MNYQKIIDDIREKLPFGDPYLAMAIGLAHVDETPDGQSDHKADHPDENIETNCHELWFSSCGWKGWLNSFSTIVLCSGGL